LTERDEGFSDPSIVGSWGMPDWSAGGVIGLGLEVPPNPETGFPDYELVYEVGFGESGNLQVVQYDRDGRFVVYTAYSSLLNGRRYLNLSPVACPACERESQDAEEAEPLAFNSEAISCPYQIVQYTTGSSPRMGESWANGFAKEIAEYEGDYLSIALMDNEFVIEAIEQGKIDGDPTCDSCLFEGACMTARQKALQEFVSKYDTQLFPQDDWDAYQRVPSVH
jgi:hypothetical protein